MSQSRADVPQPVRIESGLIAGTTAGGDGGILVFKGVPYAAAPVGELRWRPPQPVEPWEGVRDAARYGPACLQKEMPDPYARDLGPQSEDCLYLNIWTGAKRLDEKRPVMVWIHGGGFYMGAASTDVYDGEVLARKGVVVVTINYRIGPFGFLAHPELSAESEQRASGNYGLLDQIAALRWVKRNIAAFGGDPERVTIFGESAGARSVCFLMVSPLAKGLFHRAIVQSGSLYRAIGHLKRARDGLPPMEEQGMRIAEKLGCKDISALRKRNAREILDAADPRTAQFFMPPDPSPSYRGGMIAGPIIDGWVIPDDPVGLFERGKQHPVPLIVGSNKDEASMFLGPYRTTDAEGFRNLAGRFFPRHTEEVLKLYPAEGEGGVPGALNQLMTDVTWTRPARATARWMRRLTSRVYRYFLVQHRPGILERYGAFHGADIRYVFGHDRGAGVPFSPEERALSRTMVQYWVHFAATGDPNGEGLPAWPAYREDADPYLALGPRIAARVHLRKEACDLFDRIDGERRAKGK